jgi:hypothetical protein
MRYEVHPGQRAVFTGLALEDDGTSPFNLGDGAVAESDGPTYVSVELGGVLGPGHIWFVASVSRTHWMWSFSSSEPRSANTFCSSM